MLDDIIRERIRKLEELRRAGFDPYPATTSRTHAIGDALSLFSSLARQKKNITIVGRVTGLRKQGGLLFVDLHDETGTIQLLGRKNELTDFSVLHSAIDVGDFLESRGFLFKTKQGERSVDVQRLHIITKSLRPLPDKWFGLEDVEKRLRQRYLDLLTHDDVVQLFRKKDAFWTSIRSFMKKNGFLEVETPVLETTPGGADAEPFATHHNALNADFYLRISLELALKRLIVGGYEKVFEIGRIFRNEGIDKEHLQDYTQFEFYWAYQDYRGLMKFTEKLYKTAIKATIGSLTTKWERTTINWGKKWATVDYYTAFKKYVKMDLGNATRDELYKKALGQGLQPEKELGRGKLIDLLFKKLVRPTLIQPSFLVNPPVAIEPLAKRMPSDPNRVERFQIVACGTELGKGFSELNDPLDQRERFEEQMQLRAAGDKEAQMIDEDFLTALEYGMPPTAGFGLSERLFAILMDRSVRETVIFPLMRSKD
ncbi:MAG: lysine--tRNA ligase [Candidatus Harrisonbacteria bacterium CG10_big_fil_rev_8_21_14_0_10_42_17]|uniref:Lysine--tRNA ligase n=1 Tax=Candidatus Harrisonbacteria bacterium CG10_big_fil_rev_8_21_14_0_10_42_17 TaxID=1974584 RepID=A0A2M6WHP4_9BACT|nr:MAG: lysine--tRNA ligase [Candidatus Harrisonbacteria bacterium CG10_big_fil_rev_8_21_14_0_10_42_17]